LWWGQRIPAYYLPDGQIVVAKSREEALKKVNSEFRIQNSELKEDELRQDEDVLDTWFSSWLWPISVFDGIRHPENADIRYYYPTSVLVTAPDIIFFWVARMIMAGWEYRKEIPFKNVYFTGMVRDKDGRKMSKSLGNSPEPIQLIEQFGADAVRVGMLLCSPAGNDLLYDELLIEQGRNFCNKLWNALRLVKGWEVDENLEQPETSRVSIEWFHAVLNKTIAEIDDSYDKYRLSEILMAIYKLVWDDFCSWFLEMIKPAYQQPVDRITYETAVDYFEKLVKLLHPFMPFITEEIWHILKDRGENESVMTAMMPQASDFKTDLIDKFTVAEEVIIAIRNIRKEKNIPFRESIKLFIRKNYSEIPETTFDPVVAKLCNIGELGYVEEKLAGSVSFIVRNTEFYIPLLNEIDAAAEIHKLEEELSYAKGFLESVEKKLTNEKFTSSAPAKVVNAERRKKADAEGKIAVINEQLKALRT
jgi:valyl-tRNA synthetase